VSDRLLSRRKSIRTRNARLVSNCVFLREAKFGGSFFGFGNSNRVFLAYSQISQVRGIAVSFFHLRVMRCVSR